MENATEALKMSFAVLVLIAALSLAIYSFTMVRQTSAQITDEADVKQYYRQLTLSATGEGSTNALSSRIVGVETIIPTLYRYYKENYTILFYTGQNYNRENGTFGSIEPMSIYFTETNPTYLVHSTLAIQGVNGANSREIYGFDIQDEQVRREPWSANQDSSYNFIKAFVNGLNSENYYTSRTSTYDNNSRNQNFFGRDTNYGPYYQIHFNFYNSNYNTNGFMGKDYEFVERYGEYNYENVLNTASGNDGNSTQQYNILSNITDSVDILENGEVVTNNKGTTKRVIQYIYIASEVWKIAFLGMHICLPKKQFCAII